MPCRCPAPARRLLWRRTGAVVRRPAPLAAAPLAEDRRGRPPPRSCQHAGGPPGRRVAAVAADPPPRPTPRSHPAIPRFRLRLTPPSRNSPSQLLAAAAAAAAAANRWRLRQTGGGCCWEDPGAVAGARAARAGVIPEGRHLRGSRLGGPMRDLRNITQKYTDYAETHDLRIYAILRSLRSLRRNPMFYAVFTQHYAAKLHYASYS